MSISVIMLIALLFTQQMVIAQPPLDDPNISNPWDPGPPIDFEWAGPWHAYDEVSNPCPPPTSGLCTGAWTHTATANFKIYKDAAAKAAENGCDIIGEYCVRCCSGTLVEVHLKGIYNSASQLACLKNSGIDLTDPYVRQQIDEQIHQSAIDRARIYGLCNLDPYLPCDDPNNNNFIVLRRTNAPCYEWHAIKRRVNGQWEYGFYLNECNPSEGVCFETYKLCRNPITNTIEYIKNGEGTTYTSSCPDTFAWPAENGNGLPGNNVETCFSLCNNQAINP
ncbi:MAG: hypothetical protein ACK5C0_06375 [Candidatus Kapaibacterium sp.]